MGCGGGGRIRNQDLDLETLHTNPHPTLPRTLVWKPMRTVLDVGDVTNSGQAIDTGYTQMVL